MSFGRQPALAAMPDATRCCSRIAGLNRFGRDDRACPLPLTGHLAERHGDTISGGRQPPSDSAPLADGEGTATIVVCVRPQEMKE